jgi:hypothetical protein
MNTKTVCVGVDVGKNWLDFARSDERINMRFSNDPKGIKALDRISRLSNPNSSQLKQAEDTKPNS